MVVVSPSYRTKGHEFAKQDTKDTKRYRNRGGRTFIPALSQKRNSSRYEMMMPVARLSLGKARCMFFRSPGTPIRYPE